MRAALHQGVVCIHHQPALMRCAGVADDAVLLQDRSYIRGVIRRRRCSQHAASNGAIVIRSQ